MEIARGGLKSLFKNLQQYMNNNCIEMIAGEIGLVETCGDS